MTSAEARRQAVYRSMEGAKSKPEKLLAVSDEDVTDSELDEIIQRAMEIADKLEKDLEQKS